MENAKLKELSTRWKNWALNRNPVLDMKYSGQLCFEMTRRILRQSKLLSMAPSAMLYTIALGISYKEVDRGNAVLSTADQHNSIFIVYFGTVTAESASRVITRELNACDMFFPTDNTPDDLNITANVDSVIGVIDLVAFKEAQDLYPDALIDWDTGKVST